RVLAETLHDVVLGDRLEEIERLAAAATRPEVARARRLLVEFSRERGCEARVGLRRGPSARLPAAGPGRRRLRPPRRVPRPLGRLAGRMAAGAADSRGVAAGGPAARPRPP
ncbi:MAG: hypothetical protein ACK6CT_00940, partial [Planctomycetia bacterium]